MRPPHVGPPLTWWTAVDVGDWTYVFVPTSGRMLELNRTAAAIWKRCDGTRTRDQLLYDLCTRHAVPVDQAATDVDATLAMLAAEGLISPPPPRA